jgi:hypothetical protein
MGGNPGTGLTRQRTDPKNSRERRLTAPAHLVPTAR